MSENNRMSIVVNAEYTIRCARHHTMQQCKRKKTEVYNKEYVGKLVIHIPSLALIQAFRSVSESMYH